MLEWHLNKQVGLYAEARGGTYWIVPAGGQAGFTLEMQPCVGPRRTVKFGGTAEELKALAQREP